MRIKSLVERFFKIRIIRYGLVGGIGIPINDLALFVFQHLLSHLQLTVNFSLLGHLFTIDLLFAIASACAFEVSTTVNFVLNQLFTYNEQKLHGWEWVKRAVKAQLTSSSALLLSFIVALVLVYGFHVSGYLANPIGIVVAFVYNFFISNKLVFRPTTPATTPPVIEKEAETIPVEVESTPK